MAGRPQQNEGGSNMEMVWVIAAILIALACWLVWTYAKQIIVYPAFAVDYAFIWIVEHTKGLGPAGLKYKEYVHAFFDGRLDARNPNHIDWQRFADVRNTVGGQVKWVVAGAIALLAIYIRMNMKGSGFHQAFSLGGGKGKPMSLAKFQADFWRVATYSANFDPDGRDKDISPAIIPPEWLRDNKVRYEDDDLDHEACARAFAEQLGRPWHGFERATLNCKVVLILCALHYLKIEQEIPGFGKKNLSLHERETLSIAWASGKNGKAAMEELVKKYGKHEQARMIIDMVSARHAYENTVVYAMLDRARAKGGVLKEHDMLYIKKLDRNMWYGMNNCGRKRFHTEGAGIMSHYFAERIIQKPLLEPYMDPACAGIEDYMREEGISSLSDFFAAKDEHAY